MEWMLVSVFALFSVLFLAAIFLPIPPRIKKQMTGTDERDTAIFRIVVLGGLAAFNILAVSSYGFSLPKESSIPFWVMIANTVMSALFFSAFRLHGATEIDG